MKALLSTDKSIRGIVTPTCIFDQKTITSDVQHVRRERGKCGEKVDTITLASVSTLLLKEVSLRVSKQKRNLVATVWSVLHLTCCCKTRQTCYTTNAQEEEDELVPASARICKQTIKGGFTVTQSNQTATV